MVPEHCHPLLSTTGPEDSPPGLETRGYMFICRGLSLEVAVTQPYVPIADRQK